MEHLKENIIKYVAPPSIWMMELFMVHSSKTYYFVERKEAIKFLLKNLKDFNPLWKMPSSSREKLDNFISFQKEKNKIKIFYHSRFTGKYGFTLTCKLHQIHCSHQNTKWIENESLWNPAHQTSFEKRLINRI